MHFDYLTYGFRKFWSALLAFVVAVGIFLPAKEMTFTASHENDKTNYTYVFVHGFFGWGEEHKAYRRLPYWGFFNGDMMKGFRKAGYTCVAPTLDPFGSIWDRACELYAQLAGTRVDYGKAHAEACGHDRYGKDYTGHAMLEQWDSTHKINLIGHSLGGPTSTMLLTMLADGVKAEQKATTDGTLSDLFKGGKTDWVYSVTGLAAVYNGSSLPICAQAIGDTGDYLSQKLDRRFLPGPAAKLILKQMLGKSLGVLQKVASGEVADPDTAIYDMDPDHMVQINKTQIRTLDNVYYFSVPHDGTKKDETDGHLVADMDVDDYVFSILMPILGRTNDTTRGGIVMDPSWGPNDGLANTISETAPFTAPQETVDAQPSAALAKRFSTGKYYVFPAYHGAHLVLEGNVFRPNPDGPEYVLRLMEMINAI